MTYIKVARGSLSTQGVEFAIPLSAGGEAQLWTVQRWKQYQEFVQANPQVRCTDFYPWIYIEEISNVPFDYSEKLYALLPEKTGGSEFVKPEATKVVESKTK